MEQKPNNRGTYDHNVVLKAVERAETIGAAAAAREFGIPPGVIRHKARRRGIELPVRKQYRHKNYDEKLDELLRRFPGQALSHKFIAKYCGVSKQTIHHQEQRALRKLRNNPEVLRALRD